MFDRKVYRKAYKKKAQAEGLWNKGNPDREAARLACLRMRQEFPESVSPVFDLTTTVCFYSEARKLTRETGSLHEVDHIVPRSRGGKHIAGNLQVLAIEDHRVKSLAEKLSEK